MYFDSFLGRWQQRAASYGNGRSVFQAWTVLPAGVFLLLVTSSAAAAQAGAAAQPPATSQPDGAGTAAEPAAPADDAATGGAPQADLSGEQQRVAEKYRRLEELIFKMADFEATSNPRRAALLKQAYKQSKDRLTLSQLNSIVSLLAASKYKDAIEGQTAAGKDLDALLQLLLSENRSDRLKSETERIKEYIKELKKIERLQRTVKGRTEGGSDPNDLSRDQEKVADRTGDLGQQMQQDAAPGQQGGKPSGKDQQPAGSQNKQTPSSDADDKPQGDKQKPGEPSEKDPSGKEKPADSKDARKDQSQDAQQSGKKDGKPSDGKSGKPSGKPSGDKSGKPSPSKSSPSPGQPSPQQSPSDSQQQPSPSPQGQQQPEENPAQKRVREAEQKMREAQQKLEEAKRNESVEKQAEALEKLQEAIAELEEILRQMREEEIGRMLALLEGRFRKMLEMELKVYEGTMRLGKIPKDQRNRAVDIQASKLSFDQRKISVQADRCLALLLEEGSSIAFPEVVEQMRDDMQDVAARLSQTKVDRITQGVEEEIIATLEEMIAALQKAQQEQDQKSKNRPSRPMRPGDPPLVDQLAELKMIRSLQYRVNKRTDRYARLLDNSDDPVGQATDRDLRTALQKLAEREAKIEQITRDIVLGKNK